MSGIGPSDNLYKLLIDPKLICFTTCMNPSMNNNSRDIDDINKKLPCYLTCMPVVRKQMKRNNNNNDNNNEYRPNSRSVFQEQEQNYDDESNERLRLVFIRSVPNVRNIKAEVLLKKHGNDIWTDDLKSFENMFNQQTVESTMYVVRCWMLFFVFVFDVIL